MDSEGLATSFDVTSDRDVPASLSVPRPGDPVGDKYVITRQLGEGAMGIVFEALHTRLGRPVALKFLKPAALELPAAVIRFEREARATGQLRGPHVAHVFDVDVDGQGLPYIVMELLSGRDLEAEIQLRPGPFPIAEAVDYVIQACAGMAEAHALGIIHRDLKPSNLFLAENEEGGRTLKVLDFGISKRMELASNVTSTCVSVGTPLYMSPEQVRSSKYVDQRADVWSLGVMLYELLAGEPPFSGTVSACIAAIIADDPPLLATFRKDLPPGLEVVLAKALEKDANERFSDVHAFAEALAPFALGPMPSFTPVLPHPSSSAAPASAPFWLGRPVTPARAAVLAPHVRLTRRTRNLPNWRVVLAAGVALLCVPLLMLGPGFAHSRRAVESPSRPLGDSTSVAMPKAADTASLAPALVAMTTAAPAQVVAKPSARAHLDSRRRATPVPAKPEEEIPPSDNGLGSAIDSRK